MKHSTTKSATSAMSVLALCLALGACGGTKDGGADTTAKQEPATPAPMAASVVGLSGDLSAHDPSLIKAGNSYCVFSTGNENVSNPEGVRILRSSGGLNGNWSFQGNIPAPQWAKSNYGIRNIWAPDVNFNAADGKWYMYYAASQFGTKNSAIGVATSTDPCSPSSWTDLGPILSSGANTDFNAIDPAFFDDGANGRWMAWGSFFGGLKLQKMNGMTGFTGPITTIASRPTVSGNPNEAPTIFKRGAYYYLLVSWDGCCNGVNSTYKVAMGRATSITGPYLDKNGVRMDQGGGTILLNRRANKIGQGGQDIYIEGSNYYMVHHYYDGNDSGRWKMDVKLLEWNTNWPYTSEATAGYAIAPNASYRLVNQSSNLCLDIENGVASPDSQIRQWQCNGLAAQNFRLEPMSDGFYRLRSMIGNQDLCLDIANGSATPGTDVRLWSCNSLFAQNWHLEDMGNGFHRLIGEQSLLALDNVNGNTNWGNEIRTWSINGYAPQNWRLERMN